MVAAEEEPSGDEESGQRTSPELTLYLGLCSDPIAAKQTHSSILSPIPSSPPLAANVEISSPGGAIPSPVRASSADIPPPNLDSDLGGDQGPEQTSAPGQDQSPLSPLKDSETERVKTPTKTSSKLDPRLSPRAQHKHNKQQQQLKQQQKQQQQKEKDQKQQIGRAHV